MRDLVRIFALFTQLGLTIVAEVALAHSGTFELTDQKGGGTCAHLSLPLQ